MANYLKGVSVWNTGPQPEGGNGIYVGPPDAQGLSSRAALTILTEGDTRCEDLLVFGHAGDGIAITDDGSAQTELYNSISMNNRGDGLKIQLSRGERRRLQAAKRKRSKHASKNW